MASFITLGMFILDEFVFQDENGNTLSYPSPSIPTQVQPGGGGLFAVIAARLFLSSGIAMIVDRGFDFPPDIQEQLDAYGDNLFIYRDKDRETTRGRNIYNGEHRGFEYLNTRTRITSRDFEGTSFERAKTVHMICSPSRAYDLVSEMRDNHDGWTPITVLEPLPDRCVASELPALAKALPFISVLSPNAEEAMSLLSMTSPEASKDAIEESATKFLEMGVGPSGDGAVIIRCGKMGAYVATNAQGGKWCDAFWTNVDKIVDVTGCGNAFLGGVGAALASSHDVYEATLWGNVASSFVLEQFGLPQLSRTMVNGDWIEQWNDDSVHRRIEELRKRHETISS